MRKLVIFTTIILIIFLSHLAISLYNSTLSLKSKHNNKGNLEVLFPQEELNSRIKQEVKATPIVTKDSLIVKQEFKLVIPSINLQHTIQKNVDPRYESEYLPILDKYIAHGKFTKLPNQATQEGNVYLFAHRNSYAGKSNGYFERLDEVGQGDIALIHYDGKIYTYQYRDSEIISPEDTSVYTSYSPSPTLTMQTCNNGLSERLIVRWKLVSISDL